MSTARLMDCPIGLYPVCLMCENVPQTGELDTVGQGFVRLSGSPEFNKVVSAIDGSHIRIQPPQQRRIEYMNYKGFYSINMQAICDSIGRFLDISDGYPGSVHDTCIMKNSSVYILGNIRGHLG